MERYDAEDNQWVHFCRVPAPRIHHAIAVHGNTLYLIGNYDFTCLKFKLQFCIGDLSNKLVFTKVQTPPASAGNQVCASTPLER